MRKVVYLWLLLVFVTSLTGCATRSADFMLDRRRDGADIFTATAGKGGGVKLRVGPLHAGAMINYDEKGWRGGEYNAAILDVSGEDRVPDDIELTLYSYERFRPSRFSVPHERGKVYEAVGVMFVSKRKEIYEQGIEPWQHEGIVEPWQRKVPYYTDLQVGLGCFWTGRVGFNIGELADYILGWFGVDMFQDDVGRIAQPKDYQIIKE